MRQRHASMASQNTRMAVGLVGLIVAGCSLPLLLSQLSKIDSSKPLVGQATIRGAYTNTGSRDAGPDPDAAKYHGGNREQ